MCEYINKQSVTSIPLLDSLVNQRWLCFVDMDKELSFDERDHIIREWCDWLDPSVILARWSFSLLLLLSPWLIHVPMTMRSCNSQISEEHLVCYQMSQRNWVTIKVLYVCLRWCLLSWHNLIVVGTCISYGESNSSKLNDQSAKLTDGSNQSHHSLWSRSSNDNSLSMARKLNHPWLTS